MPQLTETELNLLTLLAQGASNQSASRRMDVSVRTVEKHRQKLMQAFGASTPFELGFRAAINWPPELDRGAILGGEKHVGNGRKQ